jgi:uncharacterized protein (TIGR00255 family)
MTSSTTSVRRNAHRTLTSMTGYGEGRASDGRGVVEVRIASVNHKNSQVVVRGDLRDLLLEEELRHEVRAALVRGSVTVQVTIHPARALMLDPQRLAAAWRELAEVARQVEAPLPTIEGVAHLMPALRSADEDWGGLVRAALREALVGVIRVREKEGEALRAALRGHAATLHSLAARIAEAASARAGRYRVSLQERLSEILAGQAAITPELLVRELALHAERIDVTEEQVRLAAHLAALDTLLAEGGEVGRRLEFLLQEIGREINTTGSKANDAALQALVVEAKVALDQVREQTANLA